jgi:hypothetical protein
MFNATTALEGGEMKKFKRESDNESDPPAAGGADTMAVSSFYVGESVNTNEEDED